VSLVADRPTARHADVVAADWSPSDASAAGCRLLWAPAGSSRLDGAWWPRSDDAERELALLLPVVGARLGGAVVRVSLGIDGWSAQQPRRIRSDGQLTRLGWFRTLDPHLVTLGHTTYDRLTLLVVPSDLSAEDGLDVMSRLAAASPWPDSVAAALTGSDGSAAGPS
jgi:hypothetical protein